MLYILIITLVGNIQLDVGKFPTAAACEKAKVEWVDSGHKAKCIER